MDELVRWLGEQLDEEQHAAEDALKKTTTTRRMIGGQWVEDTAQPPEWRRSSWSPARVLREIDAKRQILEDYRVTVNACRYEAGRNINSPGLATMYAGRDALASVVRLLALPYADRVGYREKWRP